MSFLLFKIKSAAREVQTLDRCNQDQRSTTELWWLLLKVVLNDFKANSIFTSPGHGVKLFWCMTR